MSRKEWYQALKPYTKASYKKGILQILNTVVVYIGLLCLAMVSINQDKPLYVTGIYIGLSSLFLVRVFILFHDCTHQSFMPSDRWNKYLGRFFGILAFTSYEAWQKEHKIHHGAVGNLDRRGTGDIWTLTIEEYEQLSRPMKAYYRLFRNPVFLFGVAPFFLFLILQRFPKKTANAQERRGYVINDLGILLMFALFMLIFGVKTYLIVQLITIYLASAMGVWMFYVQHQFEEVYWEEQEDWDSVKAAIDGSTFYKLPLVLEWLTGYIGYHHIHHLNAKIPNYHLKACYKNFEELKVVRTVNFKESLKLAFLQIYDTKAKELISFRQLRRQ